MSQSMVLNHDPNPNAPKPAPVAAPPVPAPTDTWIAPPPEKYDLMALFQRDGRPDIVMSVADFKAGKFDKDATYMLHGKGLDDALAMEKFADQLAYGTVLLVFGFPEEEYDAFLSRIGKFEFREWDKFGTDQDARAWIKSHYDGGTYGTHHKYLMEALKFTTGAVLELGAWSGSSTQIHELCEKMNRPLMTLDNSEDRLKLFEPLVSKTHQFEFCIDPAQHEWLNGKFGVVFVDHAPGESRRHAIERVRDKAEYIVCHDTEELGYGMEEALTTFKFRKDFKYARPWTTVVSMTKEIFSDPRGGGDSRVVGASNPVGTPIPRTPNGDVDHGA